MTPRQLVAQLTRVLPTSASAVADADLGELEVHAGGDPAAYRLVCYGPGGIGKTTALAGMPGVYIVRCEDGTAHLGPIQGTRILKTWDELLLACRRARHSRLTIGSILIDGFDAAESLCIAEIERRAGKSLADINESSYGAGRDIVLAEMGRLLAALDDVRTARGIPIGITAHEVTRTVRNTEGRDYDHTSPLSRVKAVAPALCDWADHVWRLRRVVDVVEEARYDGERVDKRKARKFLAADGGIVIHLEGGATFYAKSRGAVAMPARLPLMPPPDGWRLIARTLGLVVERGAGLPAWLRARATVALGDDLFPADRREGAGAAFRDAMEIRDWATAEELCEAFDGEVAAAKRDEGEREVDEDDHDLDAPISEPETRTETP